ncbi:MAG: hypothetical protein P8182_08110 [Deltaproteobacteria bacterium]
MRKAVQFLFIAVLLAALVPHFATAGGGITPEQIYQPKIDWKLLIGTWEVLPDDNPLSEKAKHSPQPKFRVIMTLRKDGTCRIFNKKHRAGSDGLWTFEDHKMFIKFPDGSVSDYYVYGLKKGFMITRSPAKGGRDQLWSRVK